MKDLHDLEVLLRSGVPLLVVETHEETRAVRLLAKAAERLDVHFYTWSVTSGLCRDGEKITDDPIAPEPQDALSRIQDTRYPGLYVLTDFHPYLRDPVHVRYLREIALRHERVAHRIALVSHEVDLPPELERLSRRFELSLPGREAVHMIVREQATHWSRVNRGQNVRTSREMLDRLVDSLLGLPEQDVRRLARGAIEDDGALDEDDLPEIMKAKFDLLGQDGVLSFEYDTARFAQVAGLTRLKRWLELREPVFSGRVRRPGLDAPRGVLLLGVQGCGKSLAAKAVAGTWNVPLLRLDFGTLYNKYHGETERNLRTSLRQAEVMAPCVLWVDEIEKGISTDDSDSGTSRRILGTLLTWMAERQARVFVVATANDIGALPPELMRKGRFDEIFFVDLPDPETRRAVLAIHLERRRIDPTTVDLEAAAQACEGFSGAEIEQAVVAALYASYAADQPFDGALLAAEIEATRPLSVVMAERIASLRAWAAERTVPA
ncbi:MAG: AAA family ATPase [Ectothiorhodospiraceae bacterium]|nr:AAA family ATPase [Ectothiorhodospiraceae bacterium]